MDKDIRILVDGVNGQLGHDIVKVLEERGYKNIKGIDITDLDITDESSVDAFISDYKPDVLFHCAAWTAVDKAETCPDLVYKVNVLGTSYLAKSMKKVNGKMIAISTDYVFNGEGTNYFNVDDPKLGLSVYGKTKGEAEEEVKKYLDKYFIVRISWLFGINGNNFVKTMIKLANSDKKELSIVDDQIGSPTYSLDLAGLLIDMSETEKYGTYHATNEGICSWAEFASYIFSLIGSDIKVNKVTTKEYLLMNPNQAKRPLNSRLSKDKLVEAGFLRLPDWQDAVSRYIKNELGY